MILIDWLEVISIYSSKFNKVSCSDSPTRLPFTSAVWSTNGLFQKKTKQQTGGTAWGWEGWRVGWGVEDILF